MDKFAQERSVLNKLREKINMPGAYLEGFFRPELDRVMTALKQVDDKVRAELTGKKVGVADAPSDGTSAKDLLKSARTSFNRREYMTGVAELGRFHKKMYDIKAAIDGFKIDINRIHHKFLFEGVEDDKVQNLRKHMDEIMKNKTASVEPYFIKEAGIMDFFYNIGTKRGRSLAAWEKKFGKRPEVKRLIDGATPLLDSAQNLLDNTLVYLKEMATARAIRRPDDYTDAASKIVQEFDKFDAGDKGFRAYYNNAIVPWLKVKDEIDAQEKAKAPPATTQPAPTGGPAPAPVGGPAHPPSPHLGDTINMPPVGVPSMPGGMPAAPAVQMPEEGPDTEKIPVAPPTGPEGTGAQSEPKIRIATHRKFYETLESMGNESPQILAKYISRYATSIQQSDPETAVKLFQIVRKIKG